jgi:hypothetical protein
VTDTIIFVQPVHDQDDGARPVVVQAAVDGVIIPIVGGLPLRLRQRLFGLQWIIDDDVRTPSFSTPPTEVASRQPWAVVSNSATACRCAESGLQRPAGTSRW